MDDELWGFAEEFWILIISLVIYFILLHVSFYSNKNRPLSPFCLPFVGYKPFLTNKPHIKLHQLAKTYGNVFSLYLGKTYVVILADYKSVVDAFSKSTTIDRPPHLFDFLPGGIGFSSVNGKEWVEQRRFSVRTMRNLGMGKGQWETIITEEVQDFIKIIRKFQGKPIDVCSQLTTSVSNNVASLVLGRRLANDDPKRDLLNNSIDSVSQFFSQSGLRNYFPRIYDFLAKFGIGDISHWRRKLVAFDDFITEEVKNYDELSPESFIAGYRQEMKERQKEDKDSTFNETNLCGNVKALLIGGSDTTRTSINWLLLAMASHHDIQRKVQKELDDTLGRGCISSWEDRYRLPYTYAVIMEGQRWRTIAPLNTSRIAQEDITICGYDIPKGATIIANNWGIHNDTRYWKEPDKFVPERFINNDKTVNMKPESYVPFSYGKRNCPGETVAMMEILLYFSAILGNFFVTSGETGEKPKLDGILGLTYQAVPQKICLIPR